MGERLRERIKDILIKKAHLRGFGLDEYDDYDIEDIEEYGGLLKGSNQDMYDHAKDLAEARIKKGTLEKSKKKKYIHDYVARRVKNLPKKKITKPKPKIKRKKAVNKNSGKALKEYNKEVSLFMDLNPRYTRDEARKIVSKEWRKAKKKE